MLANFKQQSKGLSDVSKYWKTHACNDGMFYNGTSGILFSDRHPYSTRVHYKLRATATNGLFLFLTPESFPFRQHTGRRLLLSSRELKVKTPDGLDLSSGSIAQPMHYQRAVIADLFLPPRENNPCYLINALPATGSLQQNRTGLSF